MSEDRLRRLEAQMTTVEGRVTTLETAKAVEEVHYANLSSRLGSIESTLTWLVRLIIGALVMALLAFIFGGGLNVTS